MGNIQEIVGRKSIHPFPARMAPSIALEAIGTFDSGQRVLDPMSGSGTVLAVARSQGHWAFGIDCDPLAVLNSKVWTTAIDPEVVQHKAKDVLSRANLLFEETAIRDAYPSNADDETRRFIRFWFDQRSRRQLAALATCIRRIHSQSTRDVLWSGFSRMIIAKSYGVSLAMDLSHSRPHKVFEHAPVLPFERFLSDVTHVSLNCPKSFSKGVGPQTNVKLGDSRKLPFNRSSFDVVVTSPPYLNAIDYIRCSKFSLVWMGYLISDLRDVRKSSVGSENASGFVAKEIVSKAAQKMGKISRLPERTQRMLRMFVDDMKKSIDEVARVLRPDGTAVYVLGNNQIKEVFVSNSNAVKALAEIAGLEVEREVVRDLPPNQRYLPPPSKKSSGDSFQARMRKEVVLTFRKPC